MNSSPFLFVALLLTGGIFLVAVLMNPAFYDPQWRQRLFQKSVYLQYREAQARKRSLFPRLFYSPIRYLAWLASRFGFPRKSRDLDIQLAMANYPGGFNPEEFVGASILVSIISGVVATFFIQVVFETPGIYFGLLTVVGMLLYPRIWLVDRVSRHQTSVVRSLPYLLDMLIISMEAGIDFVSALRRVVKSPMMRHDPLVAEFEYMLHELSLGKSKEEVFEGVRQRVKSGPVNNLMTAFLQADRFGSPLSDILRIQATTLRTHRSQVAQKMANEAPVKILFPLLFIFAAVCLTMFGSLIIHLIQNDGQFF
jgi:tight adherence protein C